MHNLKSPRGWGLSILLTITTIATQIMVAPGLHAAFPTTAHWRIFTSSTVTTATNTDVAHYDGIVQGLATTAGLGTGWKALVSTTSIAAITHVGTSADPVYNMNMQQVAPTFDTAVGGFFEGEDGALAFVLDFNEDGNATPYDDTWTGSNEDGTAKTGNEMGQTNVAIGYNLDTDFGAWMFYDTRAATSEYPIYGVKFYAAAAAVPEPSTYLMFGSTLLFAAVARTKRKKVTAPRA